MAELIDLDMPAKQTEFAKLVGVSQPTIAQHLNRGRLSIGGTYRDWLSEYCEHLRSEAAGRGGSLHEDLTAARIEESKVKAATGRLDYMTKMGALVPAEWAGDALRSWAAFANREFQSGVRDLVAEIQSEHKIQVDTEVVLERAGTIIRRIADYADKLAAPAAGSPQ